ERHGDRRRAVGDGDGGRRDGGAGRGAVARCDADAEVVAAVAVAELRQVERRGGLADERHPALQPLVGVGDAVAARGARAARGGGPRAAPVPSAAGADCATAALSIAGAECTTVAPSLAAKPSAVPSFGVTVTVTASPLAPLPGCERSNASLSAAVVVVRRVVP